MPEGACENRVKAQGCCVLPLSEQGSGSQEVRYSVHMHIIDVPGALFQLSHIGYNREQTCNMDMLVDMECWHELLGL